MDEDYTVLIIDKMERRHYLSISDGDIYWTNISEYYTWMTKDKAQGYATAAAERSINRPFNMEKIFIVKRGMGGGQIWIESMEEVPLIKTPHLKKEVRECQVM